MIAACSAACTFGEPVAVEGALTISDLLDRRTRLGLVEADREQSTDAAAAAFERAGVDPA